MKELTQRNTENYIMWYDADQRIRMLYGEDEIKRITAQLHERDVVNHTIKGTVAFK